MTTAVAEIRLGWAPRLGATACAVLAALCLIFDAPAAMRGVLAAVQVGLAVPLGLMALMFIAELTGGRWTTALRPPPPLAAMMVPFAIAMLALLCVPAPLYPWANHPPGEPAGLLHLYLTPLAVIGRAGLALAAWLALSALALGWADRPRPLIAGLGLVAYAGTLSIAMPDWILSLEPRFVSTAFTASMAISHLLAGLAVLLVAGAGDDRARRDLSALTVAVALGLLYLDLMQFIVLFNGNLPDRVRALADRASPAWLCLAVLAWSFATLIPVVALGSPRLQRSLTAQRAAAGSALAGLSLRALWLVGPAQGSLLVEGPAFGFALAAAGLLLLATSRAGSPADV